MNRINVAVLMGGQTVEHEVSLKTGKVIVESLDKSKYNVKPIIIGKDGKWFVPKGYIGQLYQEQPNEHGIAPLNIGLALDRIINEKVDVVFIAMHGPLGEDGTVQGLFELIGLPYTGSNVLASSLAMHKMMSRKLFKLEGLNVPLSISFTESQWNKDKGAIVSEIREKIGFPCVFKPMELGSSVGISIAKAEDDICRCYEEVIPYTSEILVEEFIDGIELTCAVLGALGGGEPIPLVPTQIIPISSKFFDYEAKYTPGATQEITPPRDVSEEKIRELQDIAVRAHKILGCGGMSRTDMIMRGETIYVLELNTIPGMTETSLYPQAARAAGISFPDLLDNIIQIAIDDHKRKKRSIT